MNSLRTTAVRGAALTVAAFFVSFASYCQGQESPPSSPDASVRELQEQVRQLRTLVEEMRAENAASRSEMNQLRQDLQTTRSLLENGSSNSPTAANLQSPPAVAGTPSTGSNPPQENAQLADRVQKLEDSTSLIAGKVDEQYQTKVETASKYRARLHGIVLMNAFRTVGGADNLDFPDFAEPSAGGVPQASFGATLRQSEIGLEVFGPNLAGARTSADIQLDFAGGFAVTGNGVNFGIVRLQTASMRFDWQHTSIVAGQDSLFLSPESPTSFASLATPAFAFAGNLWGWTPQLRVEHRFSLSDQEQITLQAGILDNLDWEFPQPFYRYAQAGEQSGQPAYAARSAWSSRAFGRPISFGVGGYYGRQNWNWSRYVDAWAGVADWKIPIAPRLTLSGEFYRGRGIGGLGAAVGRSIVYGPSPTYGVAPIRGLDAAGGWTQLKFQLTPKLEFNGAISEDDSFTADVRGFAVDADNFNPILGRNRGALGNVVFRPRSDLVFSGELRRLQTYPVYSSRSVVTQGGFSVGILF